MKTQSFRLAPLAAILALAASASALTGPQHPTFRALGMGNAFVALVDDKDALYYNPAGLNLINALGNKSARPDLAAYPRNRFDVAMDVGMTGPDPFGNYHDFKAFYDKHKHSFTNTDKLRQDSSLFEDLAPFDRKAIPVGVVNSVAFAMHNFGIGYWAEAQVAPFVDDGILLPQAGIERIQTDAVIQAATAHSFLNQKLAVGVGLRVANRQEVENFQIATAQLIPDAGGGGTHTIVTEVRDSLNEKLHGLRDASTYGYGVDLGGLWQQTPWLRLGGAIQNLGMYLNHKPVTPTLTAGVAITPPLLSSGGIFSRKVNVTVDYADMLNNDKNYKALSKLNFGGEVEQHLWWFASLRVAGGFKGGYWTAGTGLNLLSAIQIDLVTWADEAGYYTGQIEKRSYAFNVSLGI